MLDSGSCRSLERGEAKESNICGDSTAAKTKKRGVEDEVENRQRTRDELWEEYMKDPSAVLRLALNKG